jgi:hypothetical protein
MPDDSITERKAQASGAGDSSEAKWLACQQEAEAWIAPYGELIEDPEWRNRRINAAYATLWLADPRFQWAGLASFSSKQVGCSLATAAGSMQRIGDAIRASRTEDSFEWLYKIMIPALVGAGTGYLRGQLSLGNMSVFLDVYPLHRFYAQYGLDELRASLDARGQIADRVHWPVGAGLLPFGKPFREIVDAFALVDAGRIADSVLKLAWHEQVNILQRVMYDDPKTRLALDSNQMGLATGLWPQGFETIELPFSSACSAQPDATAVFSNRADAHLYDVGQRMEFVNRAAGQFDALLRGGRRPAIEQGIRAIRAAALVDAPLPL